MPNIQMRLLGFTLLSILAVGLSDCSKKASGVDEKSGDGSGGSTFTISGQLAVSSTLELASTPPDTVYALPSKVIENIYSFDKNMLQKFTIDGQGRFSAPVFSKSGDIILVAMDSTASNRLEGIRGVLSLKDDSGSLMKIPAGDGTGSVDIGTLSSDSSGKEFKSNKKTDDVSSSFSLDLTKMKEMAKTDDSARGLINVVANIKDNGEYIFAKPYMVFKSNIQKIKNTASAATDLAYNGYGIYFLAKWTGLTMESLCGGTNATNKLTLFPPAGTTLKLCKENDSTQCRTYSSVSNANTKTVTSEGNGRNSCTSDMSGQSIASDDGNFYTASEANFGDSIRPLGFNWGGGGYDGQLASGVWTLKLNDTEVGRYDLASANPLNVGNKATVYVPSVKAVLDNSNKVTRIEVQWYLWNSGTGTYEQVSNLDTFKRVVSDPGAEIADYSEGCSSKSVFNTLTDSGNTMSLDVSSFGAKFPASNYTGSSSSCDAESIAIGYTMNGTSYRFDFRPFY